MRTEMLQGLLIVTLAGLLVGTMTWPMKITRALDFEHQWLPAMLAGLVVMPWAITLAACPRAIDAYREVGVVTIMKANGFSVAWGIANILLGISVTRIGAGLTFAILTGVGATIGVMIPTIFKGSGLFAHAPEIGSSAGIVMVLGSAIMLGGVAVTAYAGRLRDAMRDIQGATRVSNLGAISLAALAGVLSAGISFTFVFSQGPIVEAMTRRGAKPFAANAAVWAIALMGGAAVNVIYPAVLIIRRRSWRRFVGAVSQTIAASMIGIQFFIGVLLLGRGMILLGALGASVGFGIQQGMQILGGQAVGFFSGEWEGAPQRATGMMKVAVVLLLAAASVMAIANTLS
jgi:L-rhamnose-H+ transport protein